MNTPSYTYLPELKALWTDKSVAHTVAVKVLSYGWTADKDSKGYNDKKDSGHWRSCVNTVFGSFEHGRTEKFWFNHGYSPGRYFEKCGVEISKIKTKNGKFHYSCNCFLTVEDLKKACRENKIKVKSTYIKKDFVQLLMKI